MEYFHKFALTCLSGSIEDVWGGVEDTIEGGAGQMSRRYKPERPG